MKNIYMIFKFIEKKMNVYIELLNEIKFVRCLNVQNLKMLNKMLINRVDADHKMMYVQVLHIENDQNVFVIDWSVLE